MKTMTCRQLGGACDVAHHGDDANEIIKAQDQHLKDAVAAGSTDHEPAIIRCPCCRWLVSSSSSPAASRSAPAALTRVR